MDNYDLPNLPLPAHFADSGEHHPWLTDEENRPVTFSRRSVTVSTSEQTELQRYPLTGDEQIPEQRLLADFDLSLPSNILEPLTVDDPEDPFGALAAYQPLTFEDDPRHSFDSELGFFEGFSAESHPDVVLAEPEWNDFLELSVRSEHPQQLKPTEQPEQSQDEPYAKGISIPESANPDTISGRRSGKRRAPELKNVVAGDIPESVIKEFLRRSGLLTKKKQKPVSSDTKLLSISLGTVTRSQFAAMPKKPAKPRKSAMPKKSATSRKNTRRKKLDESLWLRVKQETEKWTVRLNPDEGKRFMCSYANCGDTFRNFASLRMHVFKHIGISVYKCTYPECAGNPYFRDIVQLQRHIQSQHTHEKPYHCTLCGKRFGRSDNYQRHMRQIHKMSL